MRALEKDVGRAILVPRGRAPFGQHQESRPLTLSNDIPVLNGFVNTIDCANVLKFAPTTVAAKPPYRSHAGKTAVTSVFSSVFGRFYADDK